MGREKEAFQVQLPDIEARQGLSREHLERIRTVFSESGIQGVDRLVLDQCVEMRQEPYDQAVCYARVGNNEAAFERLEAAYELGHLYCFASDARFDCLRGDTRYEQMMWETLKLPEDAIARHLAVK